MKLEFAPQLDQSQWQLVEEKASSLGTLRCGLSGLISAIALRMGLSGRYGNDVERIAQYRQRLRTADDGQRFYSDSFQADELITAKVLLGWRDELIQAGWDIHAPSKQKRLIDLAAVETIDAVPLSQGGPDVVQEIRQHLRNRTKDPMLDDLRVLVEPVYLPPWLNSLFELLGARYDPVVPNAQAPEDTDLGRLQRGLIDKTQVAFSGDGSVLFLESTLPSMAARYAVGACDRTSRTRILAQSDLMPLASAIEERGLPRIALKRSSAVRTTSELVKLSLTMLWEPLDPRDVLEFLNHPWCPLPSEVCSRLASHVSECPGIGGESWNKAIESALDRSRSDQVDKTRKQISFWLEHDLAPEASGVDVCEVVVRIKGLIRHFNVCEHNEDDPEALRQITSGRQTAAAILALLEDEGGDTKISRLELEYWLKMLCGREESSELCQAEVGSFETITDPAASISPVDQLIWWGFQDAKLPGKMPWTPQEFRELAAAGCELQTPEAKSRAMAMDWLRAVCHVSQKLVCVRHHYQKQPSQSHPLFDEICARAPERGEKGSPVIVVPEKEFLAGQDNGKTAGLVLLEFRSLYPPRRWWRLPETVEIPRRECESFSSISQQIYSPYMWLFERIARIKSGKLRLSATEPILRGNVAHRAIERFFNGGGWRDMDYDAVDTWAEQELAGIFAEEAAIFNMAGKRREREEITNHVKATLHTLKSQIDKLNVDKVVCEERQDGQFEAGRLIGYIDMRLTLAGGEELLIDIKYGQRKKRIDELKTHNHLQLALYGELRQQVTGVWPKDVAYFLVKGGELLAQSDIVFTDAKVHTPGENRPLSDVWQMMGSTWRWRREQFDQGLIELTTSHTEPDDMSRPPEGCLTLESAYDQYSPYIFLVGKGEDQ